MPRAFWAHRTASCGCESSFFSASVQTLKGAMRQLSQIQAAEAHSTIFSLIYYVRKNELLPSSSSYNTV